MLVFRVFRVIVRIYMYKLVGRCCMRVREGMMDMIVLKQMMVDVYEYFCFLRWVLVCIFRIVVELIDILLMDFIIDYYQFYILIILLCDRNIFRENCKRVIMMVLVF